jgi:hypothetical protein
MNVRSLVKVCLSLITGLVAVASAALVARQVPDSTHQERLIPINVTQLPPENGAFPVEVRCEEAHSPALNKLDGFTCLVINNTEKKISALAVVYSIILDDDGGSDRETSLLTNDYAIHPDVREAKRQNLFPPKESRRIGPPGPVTYGSGTVRGVEVHLDYVEFEDRTVAGPDTHGSKIIGLRREGAARYKAWLVQQHRRGVLGDQAMAAALEARDLPQELNLGGDPDGREGARFYRDIMRGVFASGGAAELKRYLDK